MDWAISGDDDIRTSEDVLENMLFWDFLENLIMLLNLIQIF